MLALLLLLITSPQRLHYCWRNSCRCWSECCQCWLYNRCKKYSSSPPLSALESKIEELNKLILKNYDDDTSDKRKNNGLGAIRTSDLRRVKAMPLLVLIRNFDVVFAKMIPVWCYVASATVVLTRGVKLLYRVKQSIAEFSNATKYFSNSRCVGIHLRN